MANAGKKRASTSTASASNKKLKIANKQASSKHKGKAPSGRVASKQKSVDDYSTFGKQDSGRSKTGSGSFGGSAYPSKKDRNAGSEDAPKLLRDKKGKATIKEFVDLPDHMKKLKRSRKDRNDDEDEDESSESEQDEDLEQLGIEDMLAGADSDDEDEQDPSGPSTKQDFAKRAQFLSKLDMKELARYVHVLALTIYAC